MLVQERDVRIDALRALAALSVLLFHAQNAWYLGAGGELPFDERLRLRDHWLGLASSPITLGFLGLNLFFVLSGLCIHASYLKMRERGAEFSYGDYARRRFWRIYPAYGAAVLFSLGCLGVAEWIRFEQYGAATVSIYAARVVEQTLRFLTFTHTFSVETFGGYNVPLYTMAIEVHFYIAYPLVLYGFRRFGGMNTLVLSILLSVACSVLVLALGDKAAERLVFDSLLVRWPEWIAGCVIAEVWFRAREGEPPRLPAIAAVSASVICFLAALAVQVRTGIAPNLLWSSSIALLLPYLLLSPSSRFRAWELRLAKVGLFSYSIYLLHWPVLRISALLFPPDPERLALHIPVFAVVVIAVVLFSRAFFSVFEQPFLHSRRAPRSIPG